VRAWRGAPPTASAVCGDRADRDHSGPDLALHSGGHAPGLLEKRQQGDLRPPYRSETAATGLWAAAHQCWQSPWCPQGPDVTVHTDKLRRRMSTDAHHARITWRWPQNRTPGSRCCPACWRMRGAIRSSRYRRSDREQACCDAAS